MEGLRVGVTSARKGRELADTLRRQGAQVVEGPTLATAAPLNDDLLRAATDAILASRPRWLIASTGVGMTAWLEAADAHGRGGALRGLLADTPTVARGPKAVGGLRRAGASPVFTSPQETDADVDGWLAGRVARGDVVAAQVHGDADATAYPVTGAVARVLVAAPYRCVLPDDLGPARELVRRAAHGDLDVVVATSRPAVRNLFRIAEGTGRRAALVAALRGPVAAAAVGPVTAQAFLDEGVDVAVTPVRSRTGDLVRALLGWAERRGGAGGVGRTGGAGGPLRLVPGGGAVRVDGRRVPLAAREEAVLAVLLRRPGIVCRPDLLAREAWGHAAPDDPAQVKHQISRIRRKLGGAAWAVETVRSVGYRYRVEPSDGG